MHKGKYEPDNSNIPQAYRVRTIDGNSVTLAGEAGGVGAKTGLYKVMGVLLPHQKIRRLTPVECERLQGFPDGWTEAFSDNVRYKALGNAVSVPVVKAIMERLYPKGGK